MEQAVKIRKAGIGDLDTVYSFICHLEENSFDSGKFSKRYSENLENDNCIYLVAVNDSGDCIGFISCHEQKLLHHETPVFEIQEMYVAKNQRNTGIGKTLISVLEEKLRETGPANLEVTTNIKRPDARRFYSKRGFSQTHVKLVKMI
jgi:(aminoalkyl)phosphonate N-acetyltransferase